MCCQQRAERPGGGKCATYETTVTPAVTIKTSAKIIAICFIIVVASFAPNAARTSKVPFQQSLGCQLPHPAIRIFSGPLTRSHELVPIDFKHQPKRAEEDNKAD